MKGCQIFLVQHTKRGHKMYQMTGKLTKGTLNISTSSISRPNNGPNGFREIIDKYGVDFALKIYPNWEFLFENIHTIWQHWYQTAGLLPRLRKKNFYRMAQNVFFSWNRLADADSISDAWFTPAFRSCDQFCFSLRLMPSHFCWTRV
jgi:hypothetical protein